LRSHPAQPMGKSRSSSHENWEKKGLRTALRTTGKEGLEIPDTSMLPRSEECNEAQIGEEGEMRPVGRKMRGADLIVDLTTGSPKLLCGEGGEGEEKARTSPAGAAKEGESRAICWCAREKTSAFKRQRRKGREKKQSRPQIRRWTHPRTST